MSNQGSEIHLENLSVVNPNYIESKSSTLRVHRGDSTLGRRPNLTLSGDFVEAENDKDEELTPFEIFRKTVRKVVDNLAFRVFTLFLVLVDIVLAIVELSLKDQLESTNVLSYISFIIVVYFLVELAARIFATGLVEFMSEWINIIDAVIIFISLIVAIIDIIPSTNRAPKFAKLVVAGRAIRIVLIIRFITQRQNIKRSSRLVVSQNKRRYQNDGFDLDLCYITERIIAMSFPSKGLMAYYRNPIGEVARFFKTKHNGHYRIYNLCSERSYDESRFDYNVKRVYIDDHNVPKLSEMLWFANDAREWMERDKDNVIAIHCKGGKGRTGTMICTMLVEAGVFKQAEKSLQYFGDRRTDLSVGSKFQGVETPSQSRYVGYFELIKFNHSNQLPPQKYLKLEKIILKYLVGVGREDGRDFTCKITQNNQISNINFGTEENCKVSFENQSSSLYVELNPPIDVVDDVKVMFFCSTKSVPCGYDNCPFYFWFNTSFINENRLWLPREELDNPHKPKTWKCFQSGFGVELLFL